MLNQACLLDPLPKIPLPVTLVLVHLKMGLVNIPVIPQADHLIHHLTTEVNAVVVVVVVTVIAVDHLRSQRKLTDVGPSEKVARNVKRNVLKDHHSCVL